MKHAPNVRIIRVMCSGRVDPAVRPGRVRQGRGRRARSAAATSATATTSKGNYKALRRVRMLRRILADMGIEEDRFRLEWISASEGEKVKTRHQRHGGEGQGARPAWPARAGSRIGTERWNDLDSRGRSEGGRPCRISPRSPSTGAPPAAGCEESVVDLAEGILDVVDAVDIVFWPVAMDFKRSDVEAMPDGSILVSLINGAIRTLRTGGDGAAAPPEEPAGHRLRRLRPPRRHPRPGQPVRPGADPPVRLRGVALDRRTRDKTRPQPRSSRRTAGRSRCPELHRRGPDPGPGDRRGLLPARLPADPEAAPGRP